MIQCEHNDCDYKAGWTQKGGLGNKFIDPQEGDFYRIQSGCTTVTAERHRGESRTVELLGCPKCRRVFMSAGECYLDTTDIEEELKLIDRNQGE